MRVYRKAQTYELVGELAGSFGAADIATILGVSAYHVYRIAKDLGIGFRPMSPFEKLEKTDPFVAKRCEQFRAGKHAHILEPSERTKHIAARGKAGVYDRRGKLGDETACEKCGSTEFVERHHEDYSKPLEIVRLCRKCHKALHNSV